jgi:predicted nucleic acid-binding protein
MLLLDNSAWARLELASLPLRRRDEIATLIENGEIAVCVPFLLEAGWSARSAAGHDQLLADLLQLPRVTIDAEIENSAITAQRALAHHAQHRSASPSALLIAACAHHNAAGVLHYDHDYDVIAEHTALTFDSHWLVRAGTF